MADIEEMKSALGIKSSISQKELCDHIEEDDFFENYPSPVLVDGEDGKKLLLVQWRQYQHFLRHAEIARRMMRPGYDPEKIVTLKIEMDETMFDQMELICAQSGMTVAGAIEEFLRWSVECPEERNKMLEEARKSGLFDECTNSQQITVEWLGTGDEEAAELLKGLHDREKKNDR